jgi:membrane associated rhomboid family serine protease
VPSRLVSNSSGIALLVAAADAVRARSELALYALENRPRKTSAAALLPLGAGLDSALLYCVILVFIHAAATRGAFSVDWLGAGHSEAGLFRAGEWWRAITSLGLHADIEHLASNLVLGAILGLLLAQILGSGLAWLSILVCAALGNATVALLARPDYAAIGASTGVFAALGLLAASAWKQQARVWGGLRRWRPLVAAVMLLALLGVGGDRIDVGGHVAGFAAGLLGGVLLYLARPSLPQGPTAQRAFGAAAIAVFAGAWGLAIAFG